MTATIYGYPMHLTVDVDGEPLDVTDCLRNEHGTVTLDIEALKRKTTDFALERHRNRPEPHVAYYGTFEDFQGFGP